MRKWVVFGLLLVAAIAVAQESGESTEAPACDREACQLPNCRCSGTDIPGGLNPRDTPQFVTVTFDDAVNANNLLTYRNLLYNRKNNASGCPAGATFYVSHEYTNYQAVNELYNKGFEIALHSISHKTSQTYWSEATYENMEKEFANQKIMMAHFASIPITAIKGVRIPFLQMTGDVSFQMMANNSLQYDCTWPTVAHRDPGLWPYTLDYRSTQDCIVPPCPTSSIPGPWVMPLVSWSDLQGVPCSFVDACYWIPPHTDEDGWFKFIMTNFERHYMGTRAPFGFFVHEALFSAYPAIQRAFIRFLNVINNLNDVFMVNSEQVIEWVRHPVPIDEYREEGCRQFIPTSCRATSCGPVSAAHNNGEYWMQLCNLCPRVYPWLDNPLGV